MARTPEVFLPVGTETVQLEDVPALLANALYPDLPERTNRGALCDDKDLEAVARVSGRPPPRGEVVIP